MTEIKKNILQEELDRCLTSGMATNPPEVLQVPLSHFQTGRRKITVVGIHAQEFETTLVIGKKNEEGLSVEVLSLGYGEPDSWIPEIKSRIGHERSHIQLVISGSAMLTQVVNLPEMSRSQLDKALRLQLKLKGSQDSDVLAYAPMRTKTHEKILAVGAIAKSLRDRLEQQIKESGLPVLGWDLPILSEVRVAEELWKIAPDTESRFLVRLKTNACEMVLWEEGRDYHVQQLGIGSSAFIERIQNLLQVCHIETRIEEAQPGTLAYRAYTAARRQAIHEMYAPLIQQIKTQLISVTNEKNVALPKYFCFVSESNLLPDLTLDMARDLKMVPIRLKGLPSSALSAIGVLLPREPSARANFMSRISLWNRFESLLPRKKLQLRFNLKEQMSPLLWALMIGLLPVFGYPLYQKNRLERLLLLKKSEWSLLEAEKEKLKQFQAREVLVDRKEKVIKRILSQQLRADRAVAEVFGILPADIQLQSLTLKNDSLLLKGFAKNAHPVKKLLESASQLKHLHDPIPSGIRREKRGTEFEVSLRFR